MELLWIVKLFKEFIFVYFTRLEALFYFPRWMEIVYLPSASELRSVYYSNSNMMDWKMTLGSGFSKIRVMFNNYIKLYYILKQLFLNIYFKGKAQFSEAHQGKAMVSNYFKTS